MKTFFRIFALLVILGIGATGFGAYHVYQSATTPLDPASEEIIRFRIEPGMGSNRINEGLAASGLIQNADFANLNARFRNWSQVQAGEYELSAAMSLEEMYGLFKRGETASARHRITIREGERMTQISQDFAIVAGISPETLLQTWDDPAFVSQFIEDYWFLTDEILQDGLFHPFEGYFRPLTYEFQEEFYTVEEITRAFLDVAASEFGQIRPQIEASGYTVHELLAFAAIIQGEAASIPEMNDIAGVFVNRLDSGWRLQSDVGAQYVADERQVRVTYAMIEVDSPFNTYVIDGLPIGAVNSPSQAAIVSILEPSDHEYFFFIGDLFQCIDGQTHFFTNYQDHRAFLLRYLQPGYDAGHAVCPPPN